MKYLALIFFFLVAPHAEASLVTIASGNASTTNGSANVAHSGSSAWTVCGWVHSPSNSGGSNFDNIYSERDSTGDEYLNVHLKTSGAISFFYRPGGFGQPQSSTLSTRTVTDSLWHWWCYVNRSSTDRQAYIDGISQGTDTTSITNTQTPAGVVLGANGSQDLPLGARQALVQSYKSALTLGQMKAAVYGFRTVRPHQYWPLGISPTTQISWTAGGISLNALNMRSGGNPPLRLR